MHLKRSSCVHSRGYSAVSTSNGKDLRSGLPLLHHFCHLHSACQNIRLSLNQTPLSSYLGKANLFIMEKRSREPNIAPTVLHFISDISLSGVRGWPPALLVVCPRTFPLSLTYYFTYCSFYCLALSNEV